MNQLYQYWNLSLLLNSIIVFWSKFCLSFWKVEENCQDAWTAAWLSHSTFWHSLCNCKISPASSSSSFTFPSLGYGVVHRKVPSGPKICIVRTVVFFFFLFVSYFFSYYFSLSNIHSLLMQPWGICVLLSSVALSNRFGLILTCLWALHEDLRHL